MNRRISEIWVLAVVPLAAAAVVGRLFLSAGVGRWVAVAASALVAVYYLWAGNARWHRYFEEKGGRFTGSDLREFLFKHAFGALLPSVLALWCCSWVVGYRLEHADPVERWQESAPVPAPWTTLLCPIVVGVVAELIVAFAPLLKDVATDPVIRGRRILSQTEAARAAQRLLRKLGATTRACVFWGTIRLHPVAANLHFMAVGAPGSGKSVSIQLLAQSVLAGMGRGGRPVRALWNDWKTDSLSLLSGMGLPWKTLNFMDQKSVGWNMAHDITNSLLAKSVSEILIPVSPNGAEGTNFFDTAARNVFRAVIVAYIDTVPLAWNFNDVIYALRNMDRLLAVLELTEEGRDYKKLYFTKEKLALDVMATLANHTDDYLEVAGAWHRAAEQISLKDWVRGEYVLVLGNSHLARPTFRRMNQLIFKRLSQLMLEHLPTDGSEDTFVFIDELSQMGRLDGLSDLGREGRSRNIGLVLGTQDLEGFEKEFGEKEAREILAMCANFAAFRLGSPYTAKHASERFGEAEVREPKQSTTTGNGSRSVTDTDDRVIRPALLPSQFLGIQEVATAGGITGYFDSPLVGGWEGFLPLSYLEANLSKRDPSVRDFEPRDGADLRLIPWTQADTERLRLPASLVTSQTASQPEEAAENASPPKVVDLAPRRRLKDLGRPKGKRAKGGAETENGVAPTGTDPSLPGNKPT